jgi:2-polyprenyl-6-methoxyphenol hydroxylase-like FAD-dependent oxidoreductase
MTPDLAQGACQAIVDATTLATCLAASGDSQAALREYQQRRWRNAAITTLMARTMGAMGQWEGRRTCAARNALTRALPLSLQLRQFDLVLGAARQDGSRRRTSRSPVAGPSRIDREPAPDRTR